MYVVINENIHEIENNSIYKVILFDTLHDKNEKENIL